MLSDCKGYLLDANLSWRLVKKLLPDFHSVMHVNQITQNEVLSDRAIWEYALQHQYVLISLDDDFENLSLVFGFPPFVILIRKQNAGTHEIAGLLLNRKNEIATFIKKKENGILELY